eukprot:Tamp_29996.p1 GENE.Tamp_29996~~Tamp_29996.p1  ORF type:complete len:235 (+),score=53.74 Tamp_29996:34-705(+)
MEARRRPSPSDARLARGYADEHDGASELQDAAGDRPGEEGALRRGALLPKDEALKRHAYASTHTLFTGRARKSSSAVVARQRSWGMVITGALVAFVYVASYGLGQQVAPHHRGMHTDGKFSAPLGYSTKGLDFRRAYMQREHDNEAIMHEMHEQAKESAEETAAQEAKHAQEASGAQRTITIAPVQAPRPAISVTHHFAAEPRAGGVPLPPLLGSRERERVLL